MKSHNKILIVDDEPLTRKSLQEILRKDGYAVSSAGDGENACEIVAREVPDVVLTDFKLPGMDGLQLLKKIKEQYPGIEVVLITAYGSIEHAVKAMREGAFDYVTKPIIDDEIKIIIRRVFEQKKILDENEFLKRQLTSHAREKFHTIIGKNPRMQKIYNLIETVAPTNAIILIQGDSGTGKRVVAHAIHRADYHRKDHPLIEVSCGALPENLLESELFGHVKGAFTGAIKDRQGRFEAAHEGTIFLDEIDTFSPKLQVKLLRILQEGEFERVGDTKTIQVNVRVIAATNQDLKELIQQGTFREDLYYRLNVIPIHLPPLRERRDDIPLLIQHFLEKGGRKLSVKPKQFSPEAMGILCSYEWPGNVRELENVVERALILCKSKTVGPDDLPEAVQNSPVTADTGSVADESVSLKDALRVSEKKIIAEALERCGWNRKKASLMLGINRTTLYNKMRDYGLLDE
ncbi:MAG: response regulator [Candidatus Omnitrophica bacterium]|nr:response regulator [Candidatus Omnitrophota bacterium]